MESPGILKSRCWIVVVLVTIAISLLHYLTPPPVAYWHIIFQRFYYLPIIFAAVEFGWKGGLVTAIFASVVCYIPHISMWRIYPGYSTSQYGDIVVFHLVGVVTGVLADLERRRRVQLKERAGQLSHAYSALQNRAAELKRVDRLSTIGQLSASLADEIQTPLVNLEHCVDELAGSALSTDRRRQLLEVMKRECRHVNRLVTSLLSIVKPRRIQSVSVEKAFEAVMELVGPAAGHRDVVVRKDVPAGLPRIEWDADQLQQVILNLALNAVESVAERGEIILTARRQDSRLLIQVREGGSGLSTGAEAVAYDPEDRRMITTLTLSVASQIVGQYEGVITVERNPGKANTVSLVLPIEKVA